MPPYVMHTVEELSLVNDLSRWGNVDVQFLGQVESDGDGGHWCSDLRYDAAAAPALAVDFSLCDSLPRRRVPVRLWGELQLRPLNGRTVPLVRVKVRRASEKKSATFTSLFHAFSFAGTVSLPKLVPWRSIKEARRLLSRQM